MKQEWRSPRDVTLSGDHRVFDGVGGAEFLVTLRGLIKNPASLLV